MLSLIAPSLPWAHGVWDDPEPQEEEEDEPLSFPGESGNIAQSKPNGFWKSVVKGMLTIVVMAINAFFAALATQVYKIFTHRWKEGGGSDIPVVTTAPGDGTSKGTGMPGTPKGSGGSDVSSDFLNRYRD